MDVPPLPGPHPPARRRSGSAKRQRAAVVSFRVTPAEREALDAAAAAAGMLIGTYVCHLVLAAPPPPKVRRPSANHGQLVQLLGEIGRIGSNINQLARSANAQRVVAGDQLAEAVADVAEMRAAVLAALGRGTP